MRFSRIVGTSIAALGLLAATPALAADFISGDTTTISKPLSSDVFAAGNSVTVSAPIAGDAFLGGNSVTITDRVERSIFTGGNTVLITKGSAYNTFAGGNTVTLDGTYGHDVYVAGNSIKILPGTVINGDLYIGSGTAEISGKILGDVKLGATSVTSDAEIGGSVVGSIAALSFTGGSIGKDLTYTSKDQAKGLDTVTVSGSILRKDPPQVGSKSSRAIDLFVQAALAALATYFAAYALFAFAPKFVEEIVADATSQKWTSRLGTGLAVALLAPIVIFIVAVSMIGMKIAFILGLAYFMILAFAGIISLFVTGTRILTLLPKMKKATMLTALSIGFAIELIMGLPYVGWAIGVIVMIIATLPTAGSLINYLLTKRS